MEKDGGRKETEESRRREGSTCGQATKSTANKEGIGEEFSDCPMMKGTRTLWKRHPRRDALTGASVRGHLG